MRFYALIAALVFVTRILFRFIFNFSGTAEKILISLPQFEIDLGFGQPVRLLGDISQSALNFAISDGLRLSAIVLAIGMASTLCHPRQLLKSTPGALYEIAAAVSMAINLAPQLVESARRVRQSSGLRGRSQNLSVMTSVIVPVLEDALESSMNLAASMSSRGFGRSGAMSKLEINIARFSSLTSVALVFLGIFFLLTQGIYEPITIATLLVALVFGYISIRIPGMKKVRTSLNPRKISAADFSALVVAILVTVSASSNWWLT
jgi:energy-coupling factor transport system permease protein